MPDQISQYGTGSVNKDISDMLVRLHFSLTGGLDVTYLRLDTTNAPLTGALPITVDSVVALDVKTAGGVSVLTVDTVAKSLILSDGAGHGVAQSIIASGAGRYINFTPKETDTFPVLQFTPNGAPYTPFIGHIDSSWEFGMNNSRRMLMVGVEETGFVISSERTGAVGAVPIIFRVGDDAWYNLPNLVTLNAAGVVITQPLTATQLISTVAIGTAPLTVTSATVVSNLNADLLDGLHGGVPTIVGNGTAQYQVLTTGATPFAPAWSTGGLNLGGFTLTVPATGTAALATGIAGGQTIIGGTAVTDILKLQGTSGNGTLTSPAVQILVGNNGATVGMTVLNNGNVGIGTTSPGMKLEVMGDTRITGSSPQLIIYHTGSNSFALKNFAGTKLGIGLVDSANFMTIQSGGNVGIGTTLAGAYPIYQKLNVRGGILLTDNSSTPTEESLWQVVPSLGGTGTHADYTSNTVVKTGSSAGLLEVMQFGNNKTAAVLGLLGAAAVAQQANTIDLGTVLSNFGFRAAGTAYPITTSGLATFARVFRSGGTAIATTDVALGAGWGANAVVSVVTGNDSRGTITVTTSVLDTPTANPTLTLTFKDGTWTTVPFALANLDQTSTGLTGPAESHCTATTLVIELVLTPTALTSNTYIINFMVVG